MEPILQKLADILQMVRLYPPYSTLCDCLDSLTPVLDVIICLHRCFILWGGFSSNMPSKVNANYVRFQSASRLRIILCLCLYPYPERR